MYIKRFNDFVSEMAKITRKGKTVMADDIPLKDADLEKIDANLSMYHEKKGNIMFGKGKTFIWFTIDDNWPNKVTAGEYDFLLFPHMPRFARFSAAPIKDVWKKRHSKNFRGADEVIGMIEAWVANNEILIEMMSVRPGYKQNRINSFMIDSLKKNFPGHTLVFEDPTDDGWAFMQKYAPDAIAKKRSDGQQIQKPF